MTDKRGQKQSGAPFTPGVSGNPKGRPKGARNKATLALEALLDGQAKALTSKAIELGLGGDLAALRICLDRILPPRKDRPITIELPDIKTAADTRALTASLLSAVASGQLTPAEAAEVGKLVDAHLKAIETVDIVERIERLEKGGSL